MTDAAPNLGGIDFTGYRNWQVVRTPSGGTYYAVPGTGFVYDPFLSAAQGRTILYRNPSQRVSDEQRQRDMQDRQISMQERAASPEGQIIPVVGTVGGTAAGAYFINRANAPSTPVTTGDAVATSTPAQPAVVTTQPVAQPVAQPGNGVAPQLPPATPADAFTQGATMGPAPAPQVNSMAPAVSEVRVVAPGQPVPDGFTAVGASADGSGAQVAVPSESVSQDGSIDVGRVGQGALGGYQLYQGYRQYQSGDRVGGGLNMLSGATNIGASIAPETFGPIAAPVGIAAGGYQVYNATQNGGQGLRSGLTTLGASLGSLALPGVGTVAGGVIGNGIGYGLQGSGIKNDAALLASTGGMAAPIVIARRLGFDPVGAIMHKTTRQHAQENTQELMGIGQDDAKYQAYVAGMREQFNAPPPDKDNPFGDSKGNKYGSWEEYKKGGLDAANLTGVYGNIKTYGPTWASLTQEQRQAVTQANIDSGLYNSRKGEVEITDEAKAKENYDRVMRGFQAGVQAASKPATATPGAPVAISGPTNVTAVPNAKAPVVVAPLPARSQTASPGIGLNGQRIGQALANRMNARGR